MVREETLPRTSLFSIEILQSLSIHHSHKSMHHVRDAAACSALETWNQTACPNIPNAHEHPFVPTFNTLLSLLLFPFIQKKNRRSPIDWNLPILPLSCSLNRDIRCLEGFLHRSSPGGEADFLSSPIPSRLQIQISSYQSLASSIQRQFD